jgi:cation transport protein ChaC
MTKQGSHRTMRLTRNHVARLARELSDPGFQPFPGVRPAEDADFDRLAAELQGAAPAEAFWVFAYGSLIWNPCFDVVERRVALARGWRRIFCLGWDRRFRGNTENPGLMLALDRGGQCEGVAFRLDPATLRASLDQLVRREMSMVPSSFPPRWIKLQTGDGPLTALTFAMNRKSGRYIGHLSEEETADMLATACGFRGSMAEYLHATVEHLEQMGIHDRHLWRLQHLTAERIERLHGMQSHD